jgi:hypothetical protein
MCRAFMTEKLFKVIQSLTAAFKHAVIGDRCCQLGCKAAAAVLNLHKTHEIRLAKPILRGGWNGDLNERAVGKASAPYLAALIANPGAELLTSDLAQWAYPRWKDKPQCKYRSAIGRAAKRVAIRVRRDKEGTVFRAGG